MMYLIFGSEYIIQISPAISFLLLYNLASRTLLVICEAQLLFPLSTVIFSSSKSWVLWMMFSGSAWTAFLHLHSSDLGMLPDSKKLGSSQIWLIFSPPVSPHHSLIPRFLLEYILVALKKHYSRRNGIAAC